MQTLGNINGSVFALCLPVLVARYRIDTFMPRLPLTSKICIYGFNLECFTVLLEGICATLTHRHSRVSLEGIVCYFHTFENNMSTKQNLIKYLKESCCLTSDQHSSLKCFQENAFVSKIFPNLSGLFWPL